MHRAPIRFGRTGRSGVGADASHRPPNGVFVMIGRWLLSGVTSASIVGRAHVWFDESIGQDGCRPVHDRPDAPP